ncbi:MAG: phytanoyl-CoA dioxygenase family protein, partial [Gammaproteobacteria bacterium]|nr:phytanoyl-CoA dioxygenase family protein [Gammaproteobacteria bacterium]
YQVLRDRMADWSTAKQLPKSYLVSTWVNNLMRHPTILDAVESLLGPDILCWAATFFAKEPNNAGFVGWHQDITYWGLKPGDKVVTAWLALTDAKSDNGCMCTIPGTHKASLRKHEFHPGSDNLLAGDQEVILSAEEEQNIQHIELEPGEMSIHHSRLLHGSVANTSSRPRVGLSINYFAVEVRQTIPNVTDSATLVRGQDRGHFALEPRPEADFDAASIAAYKKFIQSQSGLGAYDDRAASAHAKLEAIA